MVSQDASLCPPVLLLPLPEPNTMHLLHHSLLKGTLVRGSLAGSAGCPFLSPVQGKSFP